jgi:hypothetical protein
MTHNSWFISTTNHCWNRLDKYEMRLEMLSPNLARNGAFLVALPTISSLPVCYTHRRKSFCGCTFSLGVILPGAETLFIPNEEVIRKLFLLIF